MKEKTTAEDGVEELMGQILDTSSFGILTSPKIIMEEVLEKEEWELRAEFISFHQRTK